VKKKCSCLNRNCTSQFRGRCTMDYSDCEDRAPDPEIEEAAKPEEPVSEQPLPEEPPVTEPVAEEDS